MKRWISIIVASGHKLSLEEQTQEYKKIVQTISPLVGDAGVSIEVFSDLKTSAEQMFAQGQDMFTWIPNAYIKYPCTHEGLRAAQRSVEQGMRVNITLCFSQEQAAAVYAATKGTKEPAYVSPFVGRLDDQGENGIDLLKNIKQMYFQGDGHVSVLGASIRTVPQLLACFSLGIELATVPTRVLEAWVNAGCPLPDQDFVYTGIDGTGKPLKPIPYAKIDLERPWESFNLSHELTRAGIEKFVADFEGTIG
jgi:transaldolase